MSGIYPSAHKFKIGEKPLYLQSYFSLLINALSTSNIQVQIKVSERAAEFNPTELFATRNHLITNQTCLLNTNHYIISLRLQ